VIVTVLKEFNNKIEILFPTILSKICKISLIIVFIILYARTVPHTYISCRYVYDI
jgi:hypothetical protein